MGGWAGGSFVRGLVAGGSRLSACLWAYWWVVAVVCLWRQSGVVVCLACSWADWVSVVVLRWG